MVDNATPIATLIERAEDYGNTSIELFKLNAINKSADIVSSLVSHLVVYTAFALSLLILSTGAALWLGKYLGDTYYGFFAVGGLYAFIAVLIYLLRRQGIKIPISNALIKQMLTKNTTA